MRRLVRTTALASTAAAAAAFGAVALAPIASAAPEVPAAPLGSSAAEAPDLVVTTKAVCTPVAEKEPSVAALEITVENIGKGAAADATVNWAALPDIFGSEVVKAIKAGEKSVITVPSAQADWNSIPAGAAVFSGQLDADYSSNVTFGLLSVDCSPVVVDADE